MLSVAVRRRLQSCIESEAIGFGGSDPLHADMNKLTRQYCMHGIYRDALGPWFSIGKFIPSVRCRAKRSPLTNSTDRPQRIDFPIPATAAAGQNRRSIFKGKGLLAGEHQTFETNVSKINFDQKQLVLLDPLIISVNAPDSAARLYPLCCPGEDVT
jgi:hypothetical protein